MFNNRTKLILTLLLNISLMIFVYFRIIKNHNIDIEIIQVVILVYFIFFMIINSFSSVGEMIINESKMGTLQQLIISPLGLTKIILSKIIVKISKSICITFIGLLICQYFFEDISSFNMLKIFFVTIVGMLSLYGIGLVLAIISLFSKEIKIISGILRLVFLYSLFYLDANIFIPFSYTKLVIENLFRYSIDISFENYDIKFFILFFINSVLYFLLGIILFKYIEKYALKKGKTIGY